MSEQALQQRIRLELSRGDIRLWRNNVGALRDARGQLVTYGLCRGSSDLIGLRQITVGPEHLGLTLGVFTAIEVKSNRGHVQPEQQRFVELIQRMGGRAGVARSLEDARRIAEA